MEMKMKECGNINLSFVKHWFHVLPWMICYSLPLLKTELLLKIYLNGNFQVFGKIQTFKFLNWFTVSVGKPILFFYTHLLISLPNLFRYNSFKNQRNCCGPCRAYYKKPSKWIEYFKARNWTHTFAALLCSSWTK